MAKKKLSEGDLESLEELFVNVVDKVGDESDEDFFCTRSREGIFSPALVMWVMICQRASEKESIVSALKRISLGEGDRVLGENNGSKRARARRLSTNSGGYCRARQRLAFGKVRQVAEYITNHLNVKKILTTHQRSIRQNI